MKLRKISIACPEITYLLRCFVNQNRGLRWGTCISDVPSFVSVFLVELCLLALTLVLGKRKKNFCEGVRYANITKDTFIGIISVSPLHTSARLLLLASVYRYATGDWHKAGERWMAF